MALGGDGADELFAGYDPFKALRPARLYDRMMPGKGHELLRTVMAALPVSHTNMSLGLQDQAHTPGPVIPEEFVECRLAGAARARRDWRVVRQAAAAH